MTTEDVFQQLLDENPDDWQTRLVLADWLEDREDPRAEGYRAIGVLEIYGSPTWFNGGYYEDPLLNLPCDWFRRLEGGVFAGEADEFSGPLWCDFTTRREAEDAAVLAFTKLPAERRAELLNTNR
jgi:uncharacterized protein (TIGR02996 family)